MNQTFRGCKRYEIVPYSGVYTMPYSNQSSWRTVFKSFSCQYRVDWQGQSGILSYRIRFVDARPIRYSFIPYSFRTGIV